MAEFAAIARVTVSVTFFLTALWKIRYPLRFQIAFRAAVPRFSHHARLASSVIPASELALAAALLAPPTRLLGSLLSITILALFSVAIWRMPNLKAGCGCWRSTDQVSPEKTPLFVRNGLLAILAVAGTLSTASVGAGVLAFSTLAGGALSLLILELPEVVDIVTAQSRR